MTLDEVAALSPFVQFIAGLGIATAVFGAFAFLPIRRLLKSVAIARRQQAEIRRRMQLMTSVPDAVLAWPKPVGGGLDGTVFHNRALGELLGLPDGETISLEGLLEKAGMADRAVLASAIDRLRGEGAHFDSLATFGKRHVHVAGRRAAGANDGDELAGDALWFRDVTPFVEAVRRAQTDVRGHAATINTGPGPDRGSEAEEGRLRLLLDAMPIPVWLRTPALDLAFTNHAADEGGALIPPAANDLAHAAQNTNTPQSATLRIGPAEHAVQVMEAPLGPGAGTIGFAVASDGGDMTMSESTLQIGQAGIDMLLEQLGVAVAVYGPDRRLMVWNGAFAGLWELDDRWLGHRPSLAQILERLRERRKLPEFADYGQWRAEQLAFFDNLDQATRELMHLPDGRSLRVVMAPMTGGGLFHVYEDISDQLDAQRAYRTLDAVQRHTIDNLQEAVAVFGSDGRLKLGNVQFNTMWDFNPNASGEEPHLAKVIERMCRSGEAQADRQARRRRILGHINARRPYRERLWRDDGRVINGATIPLPDGAVLMSFLDVTDEAKVEHALRARADALEEAQHLSARFIADISYEVRTPMNTITGFADALAQGYYGELNARQAEYIDGILTTSRSLMAVLADILELAAIEAGTMTLHKDALELHALLAGAMRLVKTRAEAKSLHLEFDVAPDIGWLAADERRLKQVVFNLLSNAIRFTPERGGVRLSAAREGDDVRITVSDTGIGIPQADVERVFRGFERHRVNPDPHSREEDPGAGLGLTVVKSFVELHGGSVMIRSTPNRGTHVTCRFPATGTDGVDARNAFQA